MATKTKQSLAREELRERLWPGSASEVWPQPREVGWCMLPRTMPVVLRVLSERALSGDMDLSGTYLDVWCRNFGQGLVEIGDESEHAELAGFNANERGIRSWRSRIRRLEELKFLRTFERLTRKIGYVVLVHPQIAMTKLREEGKVPDGLWNLYTQQLLESGADNSMRAQAAAGFAAAADARRPTLDSQEETKRLLEGSMAATLSKKNAVPF